MKKKKTNNWTNFLKDRSQAISSGVLALLLIVLGFLAINTLKETNKSAKNSNQRQEQNKKTSSNKETTSKNTNEGQKSENTDEQNKKTDQTKHTVQAGESLWKIAIKYYNDGYKWTQIASENKLSNPDKLEKGQVLTISNVTSTTASNQNSDKDQVETKENTYTVQPGDSLWSISQKFYNGDGFQWFKIRDANPDKVGLLSNGRPRIEIGTVLTIPRL